MGEGAIVSCELSNNFSSLQVNQFAGLYKGGFIVDYCHRDIIYGDTNGDGKIGSLDLLQVKRHIVKASTLNGVYSLAADTSKDGKIGSLDLLQVKRHIVKATNIQQ